ncbi:MAG TPA: hypothetical protein VL172_11325 [Kofleriaceae bacterium]|nr:hypothetical protein [Kofleriaceae bacterium]
MAVVTRDNALKREVQRVTAATGSTADFVPEPGGLEPGKPIDLAIFDARTELPAKQFFDRVPPTAHVQYILQDGALIDRISLMREGRVTSLLCHDARFDDDEFIASATKALRGDVFGLQKYFPWGVTSFTMTVKSYEEKSKAISILLHFAKLAGIRGPVRDRIGMVTEELMMNALYHAPQTADGKEMFAGKSPKELAQLAEVPPIQVQYGCSGRYFGMSVRDGGGSLTRERLLEYLLRAKSGPHIENKATGAGLGLVSVLKTCSKLIFNLEPGYSTEVIALFDIELFAKGKVGARSLHLFTEAEQPDQDDDEDEAEEPTKASVRAASGRFAPARAWIAAALLVAVLTALITAYFMRSRPHPPRMTVDVDPDGATITVAGRPVTEGRPFTLPGGADPVEVRVDLTGYEAWSEKIPRSQLGSDARIRVVLKPTASSAESAPAPPRPHRGRGDR